MKPSPSSVFFLFLSIILFNGAISYSQTSNLKVLFLGNSYTAVNNLPELLQSVALSTGDTILTDANTPGGYTLMGHSTNTESLSKIASEKWDYVVLQEQSQLPSFPEADVQELVYPYAKILDSIIKANHSCTQTVFYRTWGRKNGDAQNCATWPPVCTYNGMDSLLALRYKKMADDNKALISPVGTVWKYLRANNPSIELYNADESHPSLAGSYAAACTFYALILKKDPTLITYNPGITAYAAQTIREVVKHEVFWKLTSWNVNKYKPQINYLTHELGNRTILFENFSLHADSYIWYFGDGDSSTEVSPKHTYKADGEYIFRLHAMQCNNVDSIWDMLFFKSTGEAERLVSKIALYPNPAQQNIYFNNDESFLGENYCLYDAFGKLVIQGVINEKHYSIDVSSLSSGMYLVSIAQQTFKIIVE